MMRGKRLCGHAKTTCVLHERRIYLLLCLHFLGVALVHLTSISVVVNLEHRGIHLIHPREQIGS